VPAALLVVLYLTAAVLPLGLAWAQGLTPRSPWDELATGLGIVALAMILIEFLQLGRFRAITARVGSDVVMRAHQLLARAALVFVVLHPFFYVSPMGPAPAWDTTRQTALEYGWPALWPGIAAWLLLGALVAMAIGRDILGYRYEVWRALHGALAVVVAGLGVLHAVRAGRYSADPILAWVWGAMLAVAIAALLYVYLIAPLLRLRHPWRVQSVTPAAKRIWCVTLRPDSTRPFPYRAGQFAWLNIGHSPFSLNENPFSIASAPAQGDNVEFLIKELGDSTNSIGQVKPGTRAWLEGPHGHLTLAAHDRAPGIALIAGGVGIAPLIGILRQLAATDDPRPAVLLYGNRAQNQIISGDELDQIAKTHGAQVHHILSNPAPGWTGATGLIDDALLRQHFGTPAHRDWLYVLCGPPAMLQNVERALLDMGVPMANILSEQFTYD